MILKRIKLLELIVKNKSINKTEGDISFLCLRPTVTNEGLGSGL